MIDKHDNLSGNGDNVVEKSWALVGFLVRKKVKKINGADISWSACLLLVSCNCLYPYVSSFRAPQPFLVSCSGVDTVYKGKNTLKRTYFRGN